MCSFVFDSALRVRYQLHQKFDMLRSCFRMILLGIAIRFVVSEMRYSVSQVYIYSFSFDSMSSLHGTICRQKGGPKVQLCMAVVGIIVGCVCPSFIFEGSLSCFSHVLP